MSTTTVYVNDPSPTQIDINTPRIDVDIIAEPVEIVVRGGQPGPPGPQGPPGTPGVGGSTMVSGEVPSGVKNGVNVTFTLTQTPSVGSTAVYRNGLREQIGVGYTVSGLVITFTTAPLSSDELVVDYLLEG